MAEALKGAWNYTTQFLVGIKTKKEKYFFLAYFKSNDNHVLSTMFEK